jgi:hypothetical protein
MPQAICFHDNPTTAGLMTEEVTEFFKLLNDANDYLNKRS